MPTAAKIGALASLIRDARAIRVIVHPQQAAARQGRQALESATASRRCIHGNKVAGPARGRAPCRLRAGTGSGADCHRPLPPAAMDVPRQPWLINYETARMCRKSMLPSAARRARRRGHCETFCAPDETLRFCGISKSCSRLASCRKGAGRQPMSRCAWRDPDGDFAPLTATQVHAQDARAAGRPSTRPGTPSRSRDRARGKPQGQGPQAARGSRLVPPHTGNQPATGANEC